MVKAIEESKHLPVRGVEDSEMSEEGGGDVVKRHVRPDFIPTGYEVEDIDVFVEFGDMVDVGQIRSPHMLKLLDVEHVVEYEVGQQKREQCVDLAVQTCKQACERKRPIALDIAS